jgi:hypothetical protein
MGVCGSKEQTAQVTEGSSSNAAPKATVNKPADTKETMVSIKGGGSIIYCAIILAYYVRLRNVAFNRHILDDP